MGSTFCPNAESVLLTPFCEFPFLISNFNKRVSNKQKARMDEAWSVDNTGTPIHVPSFLLPSRPLPPFNFISFPFHFRERLQRWNSPTALDDLSSAARAASQTRSPESAPAHDEKKRSTVDRHALRELTFQMTVEGKRLEVQLDSLHQAASGNELPRGELVQPPLSADLRQRTNSIEREVRTLGRRVEELQTILRKGEGEYRVSGTTFKDLATRDDHSSSEELKAKLENLESEKQELLKERKDCDREIQFLKCQLQYREEIKALQETNELEKAEQEMALLVEENQELRQRLSTVTDAVREQGFTAIAAELSSPVTSPSGDPKISALECEVRHLRKERRILLDTVLKQQTTQKHNVEQNGLSEDENVQKQVTGILEELKNLEEENKTLEDENNKLTEEKRTLNDQVVKLKGQISDAFESSLDQIENLHEINEKLRERFDQLQNQNTKLREASNDFKERCASHFEAALGEIEEKQVTCEDVMEYITEAIDQLLDFDDEAAALAAVESRGPASPSGAPDLLGEIRTCKDWVEEQRKQTLQVQFEKRDLEENVSRMKRELMLLKAMRREEKRQDLVQQSGYSVVGVDSVAVAQHQEQAQGDVAFLKMRHSELQNLVKTLKEDNYKLENEKFSLLGSFYHLLERNEALEEQAAAVKQVSNGGSPTETLKPHEDKATDSRFSFGSSLSSSMTEQDLDNEIDQDLESEMQCIGERLRDVQESVLSSEQEKLKLKDELGERKQTEEEFRVTVAQMNSELTVLNGKVEQEQEMNGTLLERLRQVNGEKEELVVSLDKTTEEKVAFEMSLVDWKNRVTEVQKEKEALENALDKRRQEDTRLENAKEQLGVLSGKLSALSTAFAKEEDSGSEAEVGEIEKAEVNLDIVGLCDGLSLALENASKEFERLTEMKKEHMRETEKLGARLNSVLIEKQALQKYVRELDERKRQMKVFITKLTEEKEAMAEEMDEIKQQKMNLADALENVYHNKEGLQSKLEETTLKLEQVKDSLRHAADESKTLRESLCRVVKERDALRVALLAEKRQAERLRGTEGKWRELALGSHAEADQIIEVDRVIKEEIANELLQVEESQTLVEAGADGKGLLGSGSSPLAVEQEPATNDEQTLTPETETSNAPVEGFQLKDVHESSESSNKPREEATEDMTGAGGESDGVSHSTFASLVDCDKGQRQDESQEDKLRQFGDENNQLTSWLDAVVAEKGRIERELENTTEDNKDLVRDTQRLSEEKEQLKLALEKISMLVKVGCEENGVDCMEKDVEPGCDNHVSLATLQQVKDSLHLLSALRQENGKLSESLEESRDSSQAVETKYNQLLEEKKSLSKLHSECTRQADALRQDNVQLAERNERLAEDLERALKTGHELREEVRALSDANQIMKEDTERAAERESQLKKNLKIAQDAREDVDRCVTELTLAKGTREKDRQQLASKLELLKGELDTLKHADDQRKILETENQSVGKELQAARGVISELQRDKGNMAEILADTEKRMEEEACRRDQVLDNLKKDVANLVKENSEMKRALKEADDSKSKLEKCNKLTRSLQQEVEVSSKQLRRKEAENKDLKLCVSKMDKEKSNLQKVLKDLESKNSTLEKGIQETQDNIAKLTEDIRKLEAQSKERETFLKKVQEDKSNLEKKLKRFEETTRTMRKLEGERGDLKTCVAKLDKEKRGLLRQLKEVETKLDEELKTRDDLLKKCGDGQLRIRDLERQLNNAVEENKSYYNSNLERDEKNRLLEKNEEELMSRLKSRDGEMRQATEEKTRLEKELSCEKDVAEDLRLRLDKAKEDNNDLEESLVQERNSCKSLNEELKRAVLEKKAVEEKLSSTLDELEKVTGEVGAKKSPLEERGEELDESKGDIESLRRKLKETSSEVCAMRRRLKRRATGRRDSKENNANRETTGDNALQETRRLAREVSRVIEKNEELTEQLGETEVEVSSLERKLRQQEEQMDENRKSLERSQRSSVRLDAALESAKEVENRLRRELEEFKEKERAAKVRLQIAERADWELLPPSSADQQERAVERVMVTCVDAQGLSQAPGASPARTDDSKSAPHLESVHRDVALLESQVRKLRSELRLANDRVFDLEEELSESKRALRQKERLHQQERSRFQADIEEIEKECETLRKRLSSFGEVQARRSSFSAVMDLKGTLRRVESDMCDVVTKTARLLQRAKDETEGVTETGEESEANPRVELPSYGEVEELRDKIRVHEKQYEQLYKKVKLLEGQKGRLERTLADTLADVLEFRSCVGIDSTSSIVHEPTKRKGKSSQEEVGEGSSLPCAEELCSQLEDFRSVLNELRTRLVDERFGLKEGTAQEHDVRQQGTVPESTLHKTLEALQLLQSENEALEGECKALQSKVKEVAEGKNQLLEDALSFKVKFLKKNQELTTLVETKDHEIESMQKETERLTSLVRKLEKDLLSSRKELENLRLKAQTAENEKERIELINTEQQAELESQRKISCRYDELKRNLERLSSEVRTLEAQNRTLVGEKTDIIREWEKEKAQLSHERDTFALKLSKMEEEHRVEFSLREARDNQLREKENKLAEEFASISREKENLGDVTAKMHQMRNEYTSLEGECNALLENLSDAKSENTRLTKENALIRKACEQLRARKMLVKEKIPEEVDETQPLDHKPERAIIRESVIPLHRSASKGEDVSHLSSRKAHKRHSIARSDNADGLLLPITLSGQRKDAAYDRRRACSLPTERASPKVLLERAGLAASPSQSPLPSSSDSSSRSSDTGSSVCSRRQYCSPILSVVDMCPLHHEAPLERKPSPCPVCRKKKERKNQQGFVSSEKYV